MNRSKTFGYAKSGIVPVRSESVDASEMMTQLLLGETFSIMDQTERWFRIEADFDGYRGWVNRNECAVLTEEEHQEWKNHSKRTCSWNYTYRAYSSTQEAVIIPPGSRVIQNKNQTEVRLPDATYEVQEKPIPLPQGSVMETAIGFLGTPYLWGGRTDVGVDCSGFIQTVYLLYNYHIPCDSWKQEAFFTNEVAKLADAQRGDIVFFNPGGKKVSHVAFYLGDGEIIHASGKVRINTIIRKDQKNKNLPVYNERLAKSVYSIYRPDF